MATKKCKFCKTDIDKKASVCPNCSRAQTGGCLPALLIILFVVFIPIICTTALIDSNSGSSNSELITLDEYNQIQTGMSYEEVKTIVGSEGTVMSEVNMNDYHTIIYSWYGNTVTGANANFTFQNDSLVSKAQVGLTD